MLRIAVAQTPGSRLDDWPKTLETVEDLIKDAANQGADLVVFPECLWPAYFLGSADAYFHARAAGLPSDQWFLAQLRTWARTNRIGICAGYVAEQERHLFNAACLISETSELLGVYQKCFLWDFDHAFFSAGDTITPIDSPWGPVGLMICADARLPEIAATLAARGARLFLQPTAWVNCGPPQRLWNPQPELLVPERAREFGVPIASASKWGIEGETTFVGSSLICDAAGNVLAQCGTSQTQLVVVDVTPQPPCAPELTPEQRERLLTREPAQTTTAEVAPLRIVLANEQSEIAAALSSEHKGSAAPSTPTVFVLHTPAPPRATTEPERGDNWLLLTGPTDRVHTLGTARVTALRDQDADTFAPIRAAALDGVHLVVVFGEGVAVRTLRGRAAENRVFLVHATSSGLAAYDPRGDEVGVVPAKRSDRSRRTDGPRTLMLELAQAADKEFAPRTNPFTQRRPELYAF